MGEKSDTSVTLKAEVSAAELQDLTASASHQQSSKYAKYCYLHSL